MQGITSASSSNMVELKKAYPGVSGDSVVKLNGDVSVKSQVNTKDVALPLKSEPTVDKAVEQANLSSMLDKVNRQMEINSSNLRFKTDDSSGKMVVAIYDAATEELIRQIPTEQALNTAQKLNEFLQRSKTDPLDASASVGMLLNSQA